MKIVSLHTNDEHEMNRTKKKTILYSENRAKMRLNLNLNLNQKQKLQNKFIERFFQITNSICFYFISLFAIQFFFHLFSSISVFLYYFSCFILCFFPAVLFYVSFPFPCNGHAYYANFPIHFRRGSISRSTGIQVFFVCVFFLSNSFILCLSWKIYRFIQTSVLRFLLFRVHIFFPFSLSHSIV